ncbi:MAG TPA: hypothetical protein VF160_14790 [Candidatus Dormibacteraeota bacterium]
MSVLQSPGGLRFLPTDGPFSQGVAAEPGFRIVRVRLPRHTPLDEGFRRVEQVLEQAGRPTTALCAMELRVPKPLTQAGFDEFNRGYVAKHEKWGLRIEGHMQAARTNVAPELDPPSGPCLRAFCYTEAGDSPRPTFVISGAPEPPGTQEGLWEAMEKIMDERIEQLGVSWDDVNDVQFYGPREEHAEIAKAGRRFDGAGVRWFFARPPVEGLRLELDVRGLARDGYA